MPDGNGLHLYLHPNGGKYWRMRYRWAGKEKQLALGVYPDVSLADARKVLAGGTDPSEAKKEVKRAILIQSASSFESVAREWAAQAGRLATPIS